MNARQADTKNSSIKTDRPECDIAKTQVMIGHFQILEMNETTNDGGLLLQRSVCKRGRNF